MEFRHTSRATLLVLAVLWIVLALLCLVGAATSGAGTGGGLKVDRSFGSRGLVLPHLEPTYYPQAFSSIAPQPDGSILAGLQQSGESSERFSRYDAEGRPIGGPVPEVGTPRPEATQPDGKVVKLATEGSLERLEPGGAKDPSFGTQPWGEGKRSDTVDFFIEAIVVQASGDILVAGTKHHLIQSGAPPEPESVVEQLCVARYAPSGRLDPTFGQGGIVHLDSDLGFAGEKFVGLASRPGGGAVLIDVDTLGPPPPNPVYSTPGSYLVGLDAAGRLDPAYGNGGPVRLASYVTGFEALPEGKLLLAGDEWGGKIADTGDHESDLFLARYGDDGRPDPAFAGGATAALVDFGGVDLLGALLVEADGSILLGGSTTTATARCAKYAHFCTETPVLARFTAAGTPDPGFGTAGRLTFPQLSAADVGIDGYGVQALAPRPGGGVLIGGGSGPSTFLAALGSTGALDPAFGSGGIAAFTEPRPSQAGAHALLVDPRGRLVIGGGTDAGLSTPRPDGTVFRLLPDGAFDPSFGDGKGFTRAPGEASEIALSGSSIYVLSNSEAQLSRLTSAGELDPGFGQEGTEVADLGRALVRSLAAAPGGGVFIAGSTLRSDSRALVGRLTASGARDRHYGHGGIATLTFGYRHRCGVEAIAVQPDGRVLVAGYVQAKSAGRTTKRLAVVRLRADGTVDRGFGHRGIVSLAAGTEAVATAVTVASGGEILVGGKTRTGKRVRELLLRLTAAGRFDKSFAERGVSSTPAPREANGKPTRGGEPIQILVRPGGYLVVRKGAVQPLVAYSHRGRLDPRLAAGVVPLEGRGFATPAVAMQAGKLVIAQTRRKESTFGVRRLTLPGWLR